MKQFLIISCLLSFFVAKAQSLEEYTKAAETAFAASDMSLALDNYTKAISFVTEEVGHSRLYAYAGICANNLGQQELAKTHFLSSIHQGIEEPMIFDMLGSIAKSEKDFATQILAYSTAVERVPYETTKYQLKLCAVYKKQKDYDSLLASATSVLAIDAKHAKALEYKGSALKGKKDMAGAKKAFEELYALDNTSINANIFLGNYSYQVGKSKLASARKKYDKLVNPDRVQWSDHNKKTQAIMDQYYVTALPYLEYVYGENGNKSVKTILFNINTKLGKTEEAAKYQ